MSLPVVALPTDVVAVAGAEVKVRGLSRAEALKIHTAFAGDLASAETFILACGVGVTEDEAADWRDNTPPEPVGVVVDRIIELSGLAEGAQKSG